jgi:hypothetical protein
VPDGSHPSVWATNRPEPSIGFGREAGQRHLLIVAALMVEVLMVEVLILKVPSAEPPVVAPRYRLRLT